MAGCAVPREERMAPRASGRCPCHCGNHVGNGCLINDTGEEALVGDDQPKCLLLPPGGKNR